jgi:GTP-binding protein
LLGRSNVGKSSLLNALVGRRLARISATPGKTRAMNVYAVQLGSGEPGAVEVGASQGSTPRRLVPLPAPRSLYFLDLPGYGYARASKSERAAFAHLLRHVLHRPRLAGVVWLLDVRHEPSTGDRQMQDLLAASGVGVLAAVTKGDKAPHGRRASRETALRESLALDADQVVLTSARTGLGIPELREAIAALAAKP